MSEAAPMIVTEAEREFLAEVLAMWVHEGFTTPPYKPVFYDVAEKLGLQPDPYSYDIRRPADPAARRQAMSTEAAERLREALADALRTLGYPKHLLMDPNHQAAAILSVLVWDRLEAASIDSQVESGTSASSLGRGAPRFAATPPALAHERKATVERIRAAATQVDIASHGELSMHDLDAILDAEAAR